MAMMDMMRMLVGNPTRSLLVRRRLSSSKDTVMVVKTPYMADSITQGVLASWDKQVGDIVRRDDTVATIETDKVNIPVNTPETGKLIKQHVKVGDTVQVGSDLFEIDTDVNALHNASSSSTPTTPHSAGAPPKGTSKGQEAKDPSDHAALPRKDSPVTPTSPSSSPPLSSSPSSSSSSPSSKDVGTNGVEGRGERVERLSRMRIRIAERMKQAQTTTASLTTFNEVDLSALQRVRAELREDFFAKYAIKLGYMGAFVKACATTLVQMPQVNGELDLPREQIIYRDYVDVSVAVSTPKVFLSRPHPLSLFLLPGLHIPDGNDDDDRDW
jgi:2-oxoglutarate dehydrogenase E2 component (dihydrolipoamide succinyltransferase)